MGTESLQSVSPGRFPERQLTNVEQQKGLERNGNPMQYGKVCKMFVARTLDCD